MVRLITSTSASARLREARRFAEGRPPADELLVVGASRGAADDFARDLGRDLATFGLHRFSLTELAARAATGTRRLPLTEAAAQAAAAKAAFDAVSAGELEYFGPVARMPGFPRALARTLHELRLALTSASALGGHGAAASDVARLLRRVDDQLVTAGADDRAALFGLAAAAWGPGQRWHGVPAVFLDVVIDSVAERRFVEALCQGASSVLATIPEGDEQASLAWRAIGAVASVVADDAPDDSDLSCLRRYIFMTEPPPPRTRTGDVRLFSAPGEGREALEIVRRVLDEASRGVRFDEMAVFVRAPQQYVGLLEHACDRAGVPAWFDRGTRRPDPSGRALVAMLSCACEHLSARRFDEYLSLGEVPRFAAPPTPAVPDDEVFARFVGEAAEPPDREPADPVIDSDEEAIVAGSLRAPWRWEELIVESSVIGGTTRADGRGRWRRRLDGLAADYRLRIDELRREEPESPLIARLERDLRNLSHLRAFALPIVDTLASWPDAASWGDWLDAVGALAPRVLRRPGRVLRTLAELRPMAAVGPVRLEDVRDVLQDRLLTLDESPPPHRYGRLFVGTPHQARGRQVRVVFMPGLAERVFPQRLREDPLLLDEVRAGIDGELTTQPRRTAAERLLLKLAIGAATERVYLSYPRLQIAESRPRVPSFYALDVMRAITGRVPDHRVLAIEAEEEAGASLAWPAPRDPSRAVDDLEHDLAVLEPLLDSRDPALVKGQAHYLLALNDALRRSVISRWARAKPKWSPSDGLIRSVPETAPMLARQRLTARPYSLSALQRFATCPYQFLLAAVYRLEPWESPEPLMRLDPLTRGSLFHKAQAEFYRTLQDSGDLPVTRATEARAQQTLQEVLDRVAAEYAEVLAPAIDRVWHDEIEEIRRDLGIWVGRLADQQEWLPEYFEFSFGLHDEGRDPRSVAEPVVLDGGYVLRGSVDLIERARTGGALRVTDHKTGRYRARDGMIVDGGRTLQPVLYSLAIERALATTVVEGRLFYCTTVGGFGDYPIRIDASARKIGLDALAVIDRAIAAGRLAPAPADGACRWCDFRAVCGPGEEARVRRKHPDQLADLAALRGLP